MSAIMVVKNTLKDYATWRSVFDDNRELRMEYGIKEKGIYQTKEDPNEVIVVMHIDDVTRVQEFMKRVEDMGIMDEAGVIDVVRTPCIDVS